MDWFEKYLGIVKDFLIELGVPAEQGTLAAMGLIYLAMTFILLLLVLLLVKRVRRGRGASADDSTGTAGEVVETKPADSDAVAETVEPEAAEPVTGPTTFPAGGEAPGEIEAPVEEAAEPPVAAEPPDLRPPAPAQPAEPASMFERLRQGLNKTRSSLVGRVDALLGSHARLDDEFIEELEEILITADFGMQATQELVKALTIRAAAAEAGDPRRLKAILAGEIRARLDFGPIAQHDWQQVPLVIMVVGVNGVGKTTTIGKLARQFSDQGKKVILGAGDTFRAAADQQLQVWGERAGAEVITHAEGSDPSAVAFDAARAAVARKADVLILDTAGRLHTKVNLMEELRKMRRVLNREIPGSPHETLLVLDATTGQNALLQARKFQEVVEVTGVALTKLDGTAKGGIVVAIASQLQLPVRYVGVGEGAHDLRPFDADEFVAALFQAD